MSLYGLAEPLAKSGEAGKSGPIGFAVILLLCVACYFLFKSMSKHLRKVREEFPTDSPDERPDDPTAVDVPADEPQPEQPGANGRSAPS